MSLVLGPQNITFPDYRRDNEVCMVLDVMETNEYVLSPALALSLAAQLEFHARAVIERQQRALVEYEVAKAAKAAGRP